MKTYKEFLNEGTYFYKAAKTPGSLSKNGSRTVGQTWEEGTKRKGANIMHHPDKGYFASGGSTNSIKKNTKFFKTPEEAGSHYHKGKFTK